MLNVTALLADEQTLRLSVRPFSMTALVALLAGVLRINKDAKHTTSFRFVGNEATKLVEAP